MSSRINGKSLLKYIPDRVSGFEIRRITSVSGIYIVDKEGYIGLKINDYFSQNGSPYLGNYALVAKGPTYKNSGLGQVTFVPIEVANIGGKIYKVAEMPDGKVWMCENLDFVDTEGGIKVGTNAWYYNDDEPTYGWEGKKYGLLYTWDAAKSLTIGGWHLPSNDEFEALIAACGANPGTKLKSTTGWKSNGNGTDLYGFDGVPSGHKVRNSASATGSYYYVTEQAHYWSSDRYSGSYVYHYLLDYNNSNFSNSYYYPYYGKSVRLVKDS